MAYGELCEALKDEVEAINAYDKALLGNPGMGKAHLRKARRAKKNTKRGGWDGSSGG